MIKTVAVLSLGFLYLPLAAVAVYSVNSSRLGLVWRGFTFDWYTKLFRDDYILEAARNTLILATASTLIATLLGAALAVGIARFPWPAWFKRFLGFVLYVPVVSPDIIFAAALVVAFGILRTATSIFDPGLFTMIVAHITFQIAFVALVVGSRLASIGPEIEEAARDLYADTPFILRRILLPLLMPGIVAGAMLAFTLSLDDFIISFFTAGPESTTLPIYIYASVRRGVTPEIHALSVLIFLLNVLLVFALGRLTRTKN
ncbi:ABC transporter permease [Candidatus Sumerlaeota bacterium]|nr:ABC transporter permease [Candidatus Sumerlaeota bacterium]